MKIAVVMFELNSEFGGILNWILQLCWGLKEVGHQPKVFFIRFRKTAAFKSREGVGKVIDAGFGLQIRVTGGKAHRGKLRANEKISRSCFGYANAEKISEELSEYDGVIVAWPPSYRDSGLRKHTEWMHSLHHGKPMVMIAHDCHWLRIYPWILGIKDRITAISAVHPAAYYSVQNWPGKVVNIFNAFDISPSEEDYSFKRNDWICNTAFFKAWKHNEDGLRAAPYLHSTHLFYTGGGLELDNMLADLKSRKEYKGKYYETYATKLERYRWHKGQPDCRKGWDGKKLWDVAMESGNCTYLGVLDNDEVAAVQALCGGLTEFAYHKKWGEHWNRALIEGMIHHCVPFARPFGISDNKEGQGKIFGPENVVLIPEEASPKRMAEIIRSSMADDSLRKEIIRNNLEKLKLFDRKRIAKKYVKLLNEELDVEIGKPDEKVKKFMRKFCTNRFPRTARWPRLLNERRKT